MLPIKKNKLLRPSGYSRWLPSLCSLIHNRLTRTFPRTPQYQRIQHLSPASDHELSPQASTTKLTHTRYTYIIYMLYISSAYKPSIPFIQRTCRRVGSNLVQPRLMVCTWLDVSLETNTFRHLLWPSVKRRRCDNPSNPPLRLQWDASA